MPQRGNGPVYGMQEPEIRHVKLACPRLKDAGSVLCSGKELLFLLKRFQQASDNCQELRTGGQLGARRNELGIIDKVTGSVAPHTSEGNGQERIVAFRLN